MIFGFTALQYYMIIVGIFAVIYFLTPKKNIWIPFVVITVLFAILAYNLVPDSTDDLTTYYHHMDVFRSDGIEGVKYALEQDWFEWNTYWASLFYFYLLSRFPNNYFLPAVTILIVYSLGFYVLYKAAKKFEITKFGLFLAAMFFISTYWYYDVASGVRNGLAFTVAFACAYQQFVEKKHIGLCIIGYILATFMHSSGIIPVALVVLAVITRKLSGKFLNFMLIFGLVASGAIIEYLSNITDNSFIQSLAQKAESHVENAVTSSNTSFYVNVTVLLVIIILFAYFGNYISKCSFANDFRPMYKFMSIVTFFCIGSIFSHLIFLRLARWILPFIGALIFMIGAKAQKEVEERRLTSELQNGMFAQSTILLKIRPVTYILFIVYTAVSFWYSVNGSSLIWIHF